MSALGDVVGGGTSLLTGLAWKIATGLLLASLVSATGCWWLATHDRDKARAELIEQKTANDQLRDSIREQNRAVEALGAAKQAADSRRALAQRLVVASGKKLAAAGAALAAARATTCTEAMPAVDKLLENVR